VIALPSAFELDPRTVWRAAQVVSDTQPDAIIAHSRRTLAAFAAMKAMFGRDVPLIRVVHRPSFKGIEHADCVICVSPGLAEQAASRCGDRSRIHYVPNFVEPAGPVQPRERKGLPVVGFCGRFVPEKGLDLLLAALRAVRARGREFRVIIAGDGPLYETLRGSADGRALADAEWRGWVADTAEFFREIDVLVQPSRTEAFGLVTIEAFAAGRPVIATRTLGSSALIHHESNGLLCETSVAGIAAAIGRVLDNRTLLAAMSAQAARDAAQYFAATVGERLEVCVRETVNRAHAGGIGAIAAAS
jgi:glycosyltransferase involved in cell wall biosynthesis